MASLLGGRCLAAAFVDFMLDLSPSKLLLDTRRSFPEQTSVTKPNTSMGRQQAVDNETHTGVMDHELRQGHQVIALERYNG